MAVNDIGARVKLDGEQQYREQLRQITQQTKLLKTETQQMESAWGKDTTAKQKAAQQTELLNRQIEQQKQAVETARANVERYSEETGESSSETLKWKNALAQAETELNQLNQELREVPNGLQLTGQKMQQVGQKIQSVGQGMTNVGRGMSTYVTAPIVAAGAAAIKTTADFDESMSKVMALSGATGEDFEALRNKARQMGATTKYSAGESADALSYMALAGWDTNQMLDGLDGVMNLAAASGMDLASASDLVTDYLSAFGLEAKDSSRMADELAYAQAHSNTTTTQLGEAFGNSAAMMHSAGQSMETTTAILESFANQGMKGSEAGTALSAMMRDIIQRMKNGKIYIGETAIQVQDANGNFRDMTDILADVEAATDGMGTAEKDAALMTTFTSRSVKGVNMVLTEGTSAIKGYREELYKADGTAKQMADMMQDNLTGELTKLKSAVQELGISFGDILVPKIRKGVEWVQKQVDKFNSLDDATKDQIVKFAGLAAAIGPVLLIGGKLVTSIGKIVETGGKALEWIGKMIPGMGGLVGAVGPAVVAFGMAAAGGAALGFALKGISEKLDLTSKISDFNEYVLDTAEAARKARENLDQSTEAIQSTSENAKQVMEECDLSAELTDRYAEELYELAGKTERTTEEQRRMEAIVAKLNEIYPGFSDAVMDANGNIRIGVDDLKEYIKQLKETARIKALQSIIEEYTKKIVEATKEQIEAEQALADAEEAAKSAAEGRSTVLDTEKSASDRAKEALERYQELLRSGSTDYEAIEQAEIEYQQAMAETMNGYIDLNGEAVNAADALETYSDAESLAQNEADDLNDSLEDSRKAVAEAEDKVTGYQEELDTLNAATEEVTESQDELNESTAEVGEVMEETAEEVEDAAEKIREAYEDAAESAKESVTDQVSVFRELQQKEKTSIEEMRKNLKDHIDAYRNWNQNTKTLMESSRYATDENFRAMVNTIVSTGIDAAPELEVITELFRNGDQELEGIVRDYGTLSYLAEGTSQSIATAKTVMEYGIQDFNAAMIVGFEDGQISVAEAISAARHLIDGTKAGFKNIFNKTFKLAKDTGASVGGGYGTGMSGSTGQVQAGTDAIEETVEAGTKNVQALEDDAVDAGQAVGDGISTGARAARAGIDSAFTSLRTAVSTGITQIQNKKTAARTAGMQLVTSTSDGITSYTRYVTTAMNGVKASVDTGINNIKNRKTEAKTAGLTIGTYLANGLAERNSSVYKAGNTLGQQVANGIDSTSGNARLKSQNVANAARAPLEALGNSAEPYAWGNHAGIQFGNGIDSAYGHVYLKAKRLADAVHNLLHFSKPDEGPLSEGTEIWGQHLGQNFAEGMRLSIPDVERSALGIASAAAVIPTVTSMDIDAVTGRNVASDPVSAFDMTEAFLAAAERIDWKVIIGNREFGRILREQGAIA